jgi:DNA topoisomerase-2
MPQKVNEKLAKVFFQTDIKTHAKNKSMWGGSFEASDHIEYLMNDDGRMVQTPINYADSLFKCFDEVIVNVVDVWVKNLKSTRRHRITRCAVTFLPNGYISIFNDGQGIPVDVVRDLSGKSLYIPELISTQFLAGSNNEENEDRITGGVNGIGLSMVNNNSKHFILTTTDLKRKKNFRQECYNRLELIAPPVVTDLSQLPLDDPHKAGGTTICFLPDYSIYKTNLATDYPALNKLFHSRMLQVAAHMGVPVTYNGEEIKFKSLKTFAELFIPPLELAHVIIKHAKYNWNVVVGLSSKDTFESMSLINGIHVPSGNHINFIRDQVIKALKPKVTTLLKKFKSYKRSMIQNNLFIMISGNIPSPKFNSQTKTHISGAVTKYKDYILPKTFMAKVWKFLSPRIVDLYLTDPFTEKKQRKVSTSGIKKYVKAKYAGTKQGHKCTLLICEGDSAETMTSTSLKSKEVKMDYNYFGTFNIGGVPMNSRTKTTVYDVDGRTRYRREQKLTDNERLSSLNKVVNFNYDLTYETKAERDTLNYGCITANLDQDLDGIGQIFGLLISHVALFWPLLIEHGFVKRLDTPIIRAYPPTNRGRIISFYTDNEYQQWLDTKPSGVPPTGWKIKYYKGLATHNDNEAINIFQNYYKSLYTITADDLASATLNIYYGKDPDLRKLELVSPIHEVVSVDNQVTCSNQLRTHTKEYQLDNLQRKLPNVIDGLNRSRRKVLWASRKKFGVSNTETKIFQLSGYIAEHSGYHHGSKSLEDTIVKMAQSFVGANNLPLLLPLSQHGGRTKGGKDSGAARYLKTKLNKPLTDALFPKVDDYVLEYTCDEGEFHEPIEYAPIAPFVLLESNELPATGWKYEAYARDWNSVYKNIIRCIDKFITPHADPVDPADPVSRMTSQDVKHMPFWKNNWKGEIRTTTNTKGVISKWFVGVYIYDTLANVVEISELPFQTWNVPYADKMLLKPHITAVCDTKSTKLQIDMRLLLQPNAIDVMEASAVRGHPEFDVIEDYCLLKKKINKHLNMIESGTAKSYETYEQVFVEWFKKRAHVYTLRVNRLLVLIRLRIQYLTTVIKFVKNHKKYNFSVLDKPAAVALLEADGYVRICKSLLDSPGTTSVDDLDRLIIHDAKSGVAPLASQTFGYLFSQGPSQRMQSARDARAEKLTSLRAELNRLSQPGIIKTLWKSELMVLNEVIKKGTTHERGWLHGESNAKFK